MISGPSTATAASHKGYTQVRLHTHTQTIPFTSIHPTI